MLLLAIYAITALYQADELIIAVNVTGSCGLILVMLYGCWRKLEQTPDAIWTPLLWFRVASAVYFGLGQLAPYVANDATLARMQETYGFTDADILKLNAISVVGVICVLAGASIIGIGARARGSGRKLPAGQIAFPAIVFTFTGAILRYGLIVPFALGYSGVIPGIVIVLSKLYWAGLLLLLLAGLQRGGVLLIVAIGLTVLDLLISTLLFSKTEVLITLVFVILAVWHHSPGYKKLAVTCLAITAAYVALVPLVAYGRSEIIGRYGILTAAVPLEERLEIIQNYFSFGQGQLEETAGGEQGSLNRLSYVNVAARVVTWHDQGYVGDSLKYALIVFVPRTIWPDKPDISRVGEELYSEITGLTGTSYSPGLFAEAYWNLGWPGLPLLMFPFGILLGVLSRFSDSVTQRDRWALVPALLGGLYIGLRVDGTFVLDVMGAGGIVLLLYATLFWLDRFVSARSLATGHQNPAQWRRDA